MPYIPLSYLIFIAYVVAALALIYHNRIFTPIHFFILTIGALLISIGTICAATSKSWHIFAIVLILFYTAAAIYLFQLIDKYRFYISFDELRNAALTYSISFDTFIEKLSTLGNDHWTFNDYFITYYDSDKNSYQIGLTTKADYIKYCDWYENYLDVQIELRKENERNQLLAAWGENDADK